MKKAREQMETFLEARMRGLVMLTVVGAVFLSAPRPALASDAGTEEPDAADATPDAGDLTPDASTPDAATEGGGTRDLDASADAAADSAEAVACNGALCDTSNGAELGGSCSSAAGPRPFDATAIVAGIGAFALVVGRRAKRKSARNAGGTR
jgi:hypothetical protein